MASDKPYPGQPQLLILLLFYARRVNRRLPNRAKSNPSPHFPGLGIVYGLSFYTQHFETGAFSPLPAAL
jgi:hypothetical protein